MGLSVRFVRGHFLILPQNSRMIGAVKPLNAMLCSITEREYPLVPAVLTQQRDFSQVGDHRQNRRTPMDKRCTASNLLADEITQRSMN